MDTNLNSNSNQNNFYMDTSIPLENVTVNTKRVFFHQFIAFQISKNPYLQYFAQQNLILTHPRTIYRVEFDNNGDMLVTYTQNEEPTRYSVVLTKNLTISDVSYSNRYNCYFDFLKGCPFVVDSDIVTLLYLAALENELAPEVLGEWLRSSTRGRYTGFNPVHLDRDMYNRD